MAGRDAWETSDAATRCPGEQADAAHVRVHGRGAPLDRARRPPDDDERWTTTEPTRFGQYALRVWEPRCLASTRAGTEPVTAAHGRRGRRPSSTSTATCPRRGTTTLLEASAGTGKTWTIAALVARYVVEEALPLEQLLVVTFGRAASQELRSGCASGWSAPSATSTPPWPAARPSPTATTRCSPGCCASRRTEELRRPPGPAAAQALTDFDAATIATIHQFCQLVLRSLGVAGDTDAGAELVEDLDDLLDEVVDDLYVAGSPARSADPVFDRRAALALARRSRRRPAGAPGRAADGGEPDDLADVRVALRARRSATQMEVRKRRLGMLSYDDLLSRLADALERRRRAGAGAGCATGGRSCSSTSSRTPTRSSGRCSTARSPAHATMVLIGDPKQAIYAFRGGDVVTYLGAERDRRTSTATLGVNHRSDDALRRLGADAAARRRGSARSGSSCATCARAPPGQRLRRAHRTAAPFRLRLVDRGTVRRRRARACRHRRAAGLVAAGPRAATSPRCSPPERRTTAGRCGPGTSRCCARPRRSASSSARRSVGGRRRPRSSPGSGSVFATERRRRVADAARGDRAAAPQRPGAGGRADGVLRAHRGRARPAGRDAHRAARRDRARLGRPAPASAASPPSSRPPCRSRRHVPARVLLDRAASG